MPDPQRVLVIEDDDDNRALIRLVLERAGFEVLTASDGAAGLQVAYRERPDGIILDILMPEMDGFEACRRLREMTDTPILFLTGKSATTDLVKGLGLGADEYMTKPFKPVELVSRLRANLRRPRRENSTGPRYLYPSPSIALNVEQHQLTIDGRTVYLTPHEFEVLEYLLRHAGRVLRHNAILRHVWGVERIGETQLLKQYIYQLRQKIEPDPGNPQYIHTVRGAGYYFDAGDS